MGWPFIVRGIDGSIHSEAYGPQTTMVAVMAQRKVKQLEEVAGGWLWLGVVAGAQRKVKHSGRRSTKRQCRWLGR